MKRSAQIWFSAALANAAVVACSAPGSSGHGSFAPPPLLDGGDGAAGPVSLPFLVSDQFVPSGYMGDSPADFNAIVASTDATKCPSPRQPGVSGTCYTFAWTPVLSSGQTSAWVGIYWQYPANNWGGKQGRALQPGASKVVLYAAGMAGGEHVQFLVGGINAKGGDPTLTQSDSFTAMLDATLTTSWTRYEIPLAGDSYTDVIGGFAWSVTTTTNAPMTFYLDDITWEP